MQRTLQSATASTFAMVATGFIVACSEPTVPASSIPVSAAQRALSSKPAAGRRITPDEPLAALADSIPGFGGMFVDSNNDLHVLLKDAAEIEVARAVLGRHAFEQSRDLSRLRVDPAVYDLRDLKVWRDAIQLAVFAVPGAHMLDLDESINRVTVGVVDAVAKARLLAAAGQWPIPAGALNIVVAPRAQATATLTGYYRPLVAGLYHEFNNAGVFAGGCSLSMIVKDDGYHRPATDRFAITASHCTKSLFSFDGWNAYQDCSGGPTCAANLIGAEYYDPAPYTQYCSPGYQCEWADAALIKLNDTSSTNAPIGYIARTDTSGLTSGRLLSARLQTIVSE